MTRSITSFLAPQVAPWTCIKVKIFSVESARGSNCKATRVRMPIRNKRLSTITRTVASDKDELKIEDSTSGTSAYSPGTILTLSPKMREIPTTNILRASSMRNVMSWTPARIIKHAT